MRRLLMGCVLLSVFSAAYAAEGGSWMSYYNNLLRGLKSKVQKKFVSKARVSSVAAVRGARQGSDAESLYWKGGVSEAAQKQLEDDKKALTAAVQLIVDGRPADGRTALEAFIKDRSESSYLRDAEEALANLPAEANDPAVSGDVGEKTGSAADIEGEEAGAEAPKPEPEQHQAADRTGNSGTPE